MNKFFMILAVLSCLLLPSLSLASDGTYITSILFTGDDNKELDKQAIDAQKKLNAWLRTVKNRGAIISISTSSSAHALYYDTPTRQLFSILVVYEAVDTGR